MVVYIQFSKVYASSIACWVSDRSDVYNVTHQRAARDGGPVALRPVTAIPCYIYDKPLTNMLLW